MEEGESNPKEHASKRAKKGPGGAQWFGGEKEKMVIFVEKRRRNAKKLSLQIVYCTIKNTIFRHKMRYLRPANREKKNIFRHIAYKIFNISV